jgi:hypothetical protein
MNLINTINQRDVVFRKAIIFIILGIVLVDMLRYISWNGFLEGTNVTYYSTIIIYLTFIWLLKTQFKAIKFSRENILKIWLLILTFAIGSGIILANDYWEYKQLFLNVLGFSITPLFYFVGNKSSNFIYINNIFFKWIFTFGLLLIPLGIVTNYELYARIMIPVTFLLLLFPYVSMKYKTLLLAVSFLSVITAPDFRSIQVKLSIAIFFVLGYYFRKFINKKILLFIHSTIFIIPFFFILGAIFYDYNFFRDGINPSKQEYIVNVGENESDLLADTRTFLYVEVLSDLKGYEWIIGKSAIGSYQSSFYGSGGGDENGKRFGCEVGILNILLRNGIFGVLIYLTLLYRITRSAIKSSQNYLISSIALLLAFRWPLTFIEEFTQYDLNFFFFWILLGLISNKGMQLLKDKEVTLFIENKSHHTNSYHVKY